MENRPTQKFELPVTKKEVVINEWITGREHEETQKPLFKSLQAKEQVNIQEMTHKMIEVFVVSLGGVSESKLDLILDLPYEDYNFIIEKINEIKKKV